MFAERGIPVVPLKGPVLAEVLYDDVGARPSSDIDLLLPADKLSEAADVLVQLGWQPEPDLRPGSPLPLLHYVLTHPHLPPIELHWRVHWYEDAFSQDALARAEMTDEGWSRLEGRDELTALLLYFARDGFVGLRQAADIAAWWDRYGADCARLDDVILRYPALGPALTAAVTAAERSTGLPAASVLGSPPRHTPGTRLGCLLANPWASGEHTQIDAEASLVDGLLTPPRDVGAFVTRQVLPPAELLRHRRSLAGASYRQLRWARWEHMLRLLRRYLLIVPNRVLR